MKKSYYVVIFILFLILNSDQFYKNIKEIKNPNNYLVLVNKNNKLDRFYVPNDLEKVNNYTNKEIYLRKDVLKAFLKLASDAKKLGYNITLVSGYRTYEYQENLFNYYVFEKGIDYALNASAKPGHSEHQTGLSIDIAGSNLDYNKFEDSKEFDWVLNNAYKYGFILRYPKGSEYITGYKYEPWHYRYVGLKHAKYIHKKNITLEQYLKK